MLIIKNFINNNYEDPKSGNWIDNYNPSNGQVYGKIPDSSKEDVQSAYHFAKTAFSDWSIMSVSNRSLILSKIADLIEENLERLAKAESIDTGKPINLARTVDIPRAAANFRFFSQAITQFSSESHNMTSEKAINFTLRQPLGVVGCISPWNLPLYLFSWKIAPALAAGNCVIAKPSEVTPVTAFILSEICLKAGLPPGVLNIVHGNGKTAGEAIITHPNIKAISFTGGTKTGAHIAKTAGPLFKKLSLELGGKNPNIIFADCDYEKMLDTTVKSSFSNQGQICLCGSRIYIEESIYSQFKTDFTQKVKQLKVGQPANSNSDLGAVVSKEHHEKILNHINKAQLEGGHILTGGKALKIKNHESGYYISPTVIEIPTNDCSIIENEVFGPVVTIMPFRKDDEALSFANATTYGLSATLWTNNLKRAMYFSQNLECGIVWINTWMLRDLRTPFGGIKNSGIGREGGFEALKFFTETKNVCINY